MAYDVSATPLRRIFPYSSCCDRAILPGRQGGSYDYCCCCDDPRQSRSSAKFVFFLRGGGDRRHRRVGGGDGVGGGLDDVVRVWCQRGAGILQCLCDACKILVAIMER